MRSRRLNVARYQAWRPRASPPATRGQAVLAFDGDVYGGLQARTSSADDLDWAAEHLCILSGLYGVLRPLDRMQPYRLEMGTPLATTRAPTCTSSGAPHRRAPQPAAGGRHHARWW
jgi:cytoplasmic iron level regulating protein YaaA (DUF328/UPF0246 family)